MTHLTFDILITLPSASFEDVLQGFGTQVDSCSSRSGLLSGHRTWPWTSPNLFVFLFFCLVLAPCYLDIAIFVVIEKN